MSLTEQLVASLRSCEPHALIVDDDPIYAEGFGLMLDRLGCTHTWAQSVKAAFQVLESAARFDILFLDIRIPGTGSWHEIYERYKTIPTIIVSGFVSPEMFAGDTRWGHLTVMQKPVRESELRGVFIAHNIRLPQTGECVCR